MRKVELRMNEEYKYKIIKKLVETNGNKQRAAVKLKRSIRQIDRMIASYKSFGKEFLYTEIVEENQQKPLLRILKLKLNYYILLNILIVLIQILKNI